MNNPQVQPSVDCELPCIRDLQGQVGRTGTACFFLTALRESGAPDGKQNLELILEDSSGSIVGLLRQECGAGCTPTAQRFVRLTVTVRKADTGIWLDVSHIDPAEPDQVPYVSPLLPTGYCPPVARDALERLRGLEFILPDSLSRFLRRVLMDPAIGIPFLTCRASVNHHHAYPGGLLVHSTEMLYEARSMAAKVLPGDSSAPDLAELGYALHDIGKIRTVGTTRRPPYALAMRHEMMTIELLAPHLQWLEQWDPPSAAALRYVFTYLAIPHGSRGRCRYAVAEIIESLDQRSASTFSRRDIYSLLGERRPTVPLDKPS